MEPDIVPGVVTQSGRGGKDGFMPKFRSPLPGGLCASQHSERLCLSARRRRVPEDYAATIFEIYNEALSNVARHAGASRVAIALTITPHEVTVVVSDNGIGLGIEEPAQATGGLATIRARSQTYKGFCEVAGVRNTGTTVTVSLPLPL